MFETSRLSTDFVFAYTKNREYTVTFSIFAENASIARTNGIVTNTFTFVEEPASTADGGSLSVESSSSDDKLTLKVKNTPDSANSIAKVSITAVTVVAEVTVGEDASGNDLVGKEIRRRYPLPNYDEAIDANTKTTNYDLTSITGRDDANAEEEIIFNFTSNSVGLNSTQDGVIDVTFSDVTDLSILNGHQYDLTFIVDTWRKFNIKSIWNTINNS